MKLSSLDIGEIFKLNITDKNKLFVHGGKRVKNENTYTDPNKKPLITVTDRSITTQVTDSSAA